MSSSHSTGSWVSVYAKLPVKMYPDEPGLTVKMYPDEHGLPVKMYPDEPGLARDKEEN